MQTFLVLSFLFYLVWAPLLTVGVIVFSIKRMKPDMASSVRMLLHTAFLTVVAGPIAMTDGPLPGLMPWWAAGDLGKSFSTENYIALYGIAVFSILILGMLFKGSKVDVDIHPK
ncbi:hypothetical protein ABIC83_002868 [Roseateles asaccharophilus]|uniref:hypothetical protein n=1 Tax=Roseateles asaccharophilus TaxID=582607 RepID=UPI003834FC33